MSALTLPGISIRLIQDLAAHWREVRKHHPDRGGDKAKFQAVQLAYETLRRRCEADAPNKDHCHAQ